MLTLERQKTNVMCPLIDQAYCPEFPGMTQGRRNQVEPTTLLS